MQRKISVIKEGTEIQIFVPSRYSDRYMHYTYLLDTKPSININAWRLYAVKIADAHCEDIMTLCSCIEWEGAILEKGAPDFVGGYHGDENALGLSILADNELILDEDFSIECSYLKLTTESILNRADTPSEDVFKRCKIIEWQNGSMTISNRFELLCDMDIDRFENIMMALPLFVQGQRFITHISSNTHPLPSYVSDNADENRENPIFSGDKNATSYDFFAPDFKFHAKIEAFFERGKYPNGFRVIDNWRVRTDKVCKAYFNMTGKYNGVKGEEFLSKAIYTLEP